MLSYEDHRVHILSLAAAQPNSKDLLDEADSLAYLARLRHTKWFQAKANILPSCVVIIRVLRDFCERVAAWKPLPQWVCTASFTTSSLVYAF